MLKSDTISDYFELTKPRILLLVLAMTALGYHMGNGETFFSELFFWLLFGTSCVCAGSSVLNHYLEREFDSKMLRTKNRPIPAGRILPSRALNFGILLVLCGLFFLYTQVNILTAFLSLLTSFLYIMVYTPMKRVSWLNTTIGAVPGAIPPLGGWAAATGTLNFDAGMLFLILFVWQHPHFYAIAWMFKDDYNRAGFKMLPCVEPDGRRMMKHILLYSLILIPVSVVSSLRGVTGIFYFSGALIAGVLLLRAGWQFTQTKSIVDAKNLLRATVFYLPLLFVLIIFDGFF